MLHDIELLRAGHPPKSTELLPIIISIGAQHFFFSQVPEHSVFSILSILSELSHIRVTPLILSYVFTLSKEVFKDTGVADYWCVDIALFSTTNYLTRSFIPFSGNPTLLLSKQQKSMV